MYRIHPKYVLTLLAATTMFFITSCNKEEEDVDTENPKMIWIQPEFGAAIMFDQDITVGFSDNIGLASASFTVNTEDGAEAATASGTLSGTSGEVTWTNDGVSLKKGSYTIDVTVTDAAGNTNAASNKFPVTEPNSSGFESNQVQVYFRGSPNSWGAAEMTLIEDNTWFIDSLAMNSSATTEFKLANTDNWTHIDWGAEKGTDISGLTGTMALKEVEAELDADGNKISETVLRGDNDNMKFDGSVLDDGDNFYSLTFNDETFEYIVAYVGPTGNSGPPYESIGLIGFALTGDDTGWEDGKDVVMASSDLVNYNITTYLFEGDVKFRADGAWTYNWGSMDFPSGTAADGGDNVPVTPEGTYFVTFIDGEENTYEFAAVTTVGLIGSATPEGWDADQDMAQSEEDKNLYSITLDLVEGEMKFRANDDWAINWGGSEGAIEFNGGNIAVAEAGNYTIDFHTVDQTYMVTKN